MTGAELMHSGIAGPKLTGTNRCGSCVVFPSIVPSADDTVYIVVDDFGPKLAGLTARPIPRSAIERPSCRIWKPASTTIRCGSLPSIPAKVGRATCHMNLRLSSSESRHRSAANCPARSRTSSISIHSQRVSFRYVWHKLGCRRAAAQSSVGLSFRISRAPRASEAKQRSLFARSR